MLLTLHLASRPRLGRLGHGFNCVHEQVRLGPRAGRIDPESPYGLGPAASLGPSLSQGPRSQARWGGLGGSSSLSQDPDAPVKADGAGGGSGIGVREPVALGAYSVSLS